LSEKTSYLEEDLEHQEQHCPRKPIVGRGTSSGPLTCIITNAE